MEAAKKRILTRKRNKIHVRKKISGTEARPRVSVFRSANHIYAQAIDDERGAVIASISSVGKGTKDKIGGYTGNKAVGWNILGYHGTRSDDAATTNGHTVQYYSHRANPAFIFNDNTFGRHTLVDEANIRIIKYVVGGIDVNHWG